VHPSTDPPAAPASTSPKAFLPIPNAVSLPPPALAPVPTVPQAPVGRGSSPSSPSASGSNAQGSQGMSSESVISLQVGLGLGVLLGAVSGLLIQRGVSWLSNRVRGVRTMRHHRFDRPPATEMPMEELAEAP
jgi:hypothetical protein